MHIITTITIFTAGVLTIINIVTTACQRLSTTGEISCSAVSENPSTSPPPSLVNSFTHHHCPGFRPDFNRFFAVSIGPRWLLLVWDISCWDKRVGIYLCVISQVRSIPSRYILTRTSQRVMSQTVMIPTQLKQLVMGVRHSLMVSRLD